MIKSYQILVYADDVTIFARSLRSMTNILTNICDYLCKARKENEGFRVNNQ